MSATAWRRDSRPAIDIGSGGEQLARAIAVQIISNLDEQCDFLENRWRARDEDWANFLGIPYKPTRIQRVPKESIYIGAQPSLVVGENSRFDKWPAITIRADVRSPSDVGEQPDQFDSIDVLMVVEVLARVGPFDQDPLDGDRSTSDAVDSQYQRLSDAVVGCVNVDRTLGSNILPIKLPPRMNPSLPWIRREEQGRGGFLVFQAMELTWIATKLIQ